MEAERLLVLGAGADQLGLLAAAREREVFVIAADPDPGAPGFRYAERRAILSAEDEPALDRLAGAERVNGVIAPGSDQAVGVAARIAERYGLPHPVSPEAATLSTSRVRQRERLLAAGIPQARWQVVTRPEEPEIRPPCLVRAADRQSRRALTVVRSPGELEPAVAGALRASRSGRCLIEELLEGPEVTVNGFSLAGRFHSLAVTDLLTLGDGYAHVWPSRPAGTDTALAVAAQAAQALGFSDGPTFTRLRITPAGPRVIRAAARVGSTPHAHLCEQALGIDLNGLALSAALGDEIGPERLDPVHRAGVCVLDPAVPAAQYVRFGTGNA